MPGWRLVQVWQLEPATGCVMQDGNRRKGTQQDCSPGEHPCVLQAGGPFVLLISETMLYEGAKTEWNQSLWGLSQATAL